MNRKPYLLVLLILSPFLIAAQLDTNDEISELYAAAKEKLQSVPHASDSLLQLIKTACLSRENEICNKDSLQLLQANIYNSIASNSAYINIDTAIYYNKRSFELYEQITNGDISQAIFTKAKINTADGKYKEAIKAYNDYISHHDKYDGRINIAKAEYEKSICFLRAGTQDSGMVYLFKAIPVFENEGLDRDLANSFMAVGIGNRVLKQYEDSKTYFTKAMHLFEKLDDDSGQTRVMANLANTVFLEGDTLAAISVYKSTARKAQTLGDKRIEVLSLYNAANGYYQLSKYDSATVYIDRAITVGKDMGKRITYMNDYKKGVIDIELGNYIRGLSKLEGAYNVAMELSSYVDAGDMAHYLDRGYAAINDYEKALSYSHRHTELKDSVISIESNATINELRTKYETEKKELQIENLEQQNSIQRQRLLGGGVALGLISLLSFFLFRLYRKVDTQKKVISKALSEKDLLLREIHHRVKNNLQLVSSLLTLQSRSINDATALQAINEGKSRVRSMALIHQDLYNKENLTGIGVKAYVEKLTQELFDTYRVDKDKITLQTNIQDLELDVDTVVPLGLIINELITNSLKYAFPEQQSGLLSVSLESIDGKLVLIVKDNGVGYDPSLSSENSFGATLISALTEQLEGKMKVDHTHGTKTSVTIDLASLEK